MLLSNIMITDSTNSKYSLLVHGGSGNIKSIEPFREALMEALAEGEKLLKLGRTAVEVVLSSVMILENAPRLNAGTGSALNENGEIEMEAAIIDGSDLSCGAVASIDKIKNPLLVAEEIRKDPTIVKLIGRGAMHYAAEHGIPFVDNEELMTARQRKKYNKWLESQGLIIDGEEEKMGTVGTVAIDRCGNMAAATSTGGLTGKKVGRVGDSSTIGAGTYANSQAAVSATGRGEDFIRLSLASRIAFYAERGLTAKEAAVQAITELEKIGGRGGVIVVDKNYHIGSAKTSSTKGLAHGAVTSEIDPVISLEPYEVS